MRNYPLAFMLCLLLLGVSAFPVVTARAQGQTSDTDKTVTYRIIPGKGQKVRFEARTDIESYAGQTDQISGEITCRPRRPADNPAARFEVRPATFATGNTSRDSKMRRDHLLTDLFPSALFTLTKIDIPSSGAPALDFDKPLLGSLHGTLALHGVTREVVPMVTITRRRDNSGRDTIHIVARFTIRLRDFAIPTPRFLFLSVKQNHPVTVDIVAVAD
jgi:polyisoprenoid-binding protein YceI